MSHSTWPSLPPLKKETKRKYQAALDDMDKAKPDAQALTSAYRALPATDQPSVREILGARERLQGAALKLERDMGRWTQKLRPGFDQATRTKVATFSENARRNGRDLHSSSEVLRPHLEEWQRREEQLLLELQEQDMTRLQQDLHRVVRDQKSSLTPEDPDPYSHSLLPPPMHRARRPAPTTRTQPSATFSANIRQHPSQRGPNVVAPHRPVSVQSHSIGARTTSTAGGSQRSSSGESGYIASQGSGSGRLDEEQAQQAHHQDARPSNPRQNPFGREPYSHEWQQDEPNA